MPTASTISPHPGPQTDFIQCIADIAIFGGTAGPGKSFCLLLDPLRNVDDPKFNAVTFRRTSKQISIGGGLWDTSLNLYRSKGSEPVEHKMLHRFPSGAKIQFSHLEHPKNRFDHQGAQYPFIGFDELTHFEKQMFWYLVTRSRQPDGYVGPCYVRATTNPTDIEDPIGGWVRELVDWWIDPDTGYPIPERSGVIRYLTVEDNEVVWVPADWRDEDGLPPKSFTFISATLDDNPTADPGYKATLRAQDKVTRERLLKGNWNISYKEGMFDQRWFKRIPVEEVPPGIKWLRYWDFAASEVKPGKDPDWTAGARCGLHGNDLYISDIRHFRKTPAQTELEVRLAADRDGPGTEVGIEEEMGSAGKFVTSHYKKNVLPDRIVYADPPSGKKTERASPWCAKAELGNVYVVEGPWVNSFLSEAETFPNGKRDQVDAVSGAWKLISSGNKVWKQADGMTAGFKIGWSNLDDGTRLLVSQWTSNNETSVLLMIWTARTGRLVVFDELITSNSSAEMIIVSLTRMLRNDTDDIYRNFKTQWEWYGNKEMFGKAGDMRSVYRKYRINIRPNHKFDENGSILYVDRLLSRKKLLLHNKCQHLSRQMCSWTRENNRPEEGYGLCRALCNVVSALWEQGRINPTKPSMKPYSQAHTSYLKDLARRAQMEAQLRNAGHPSISGSSSAPSADGWMIV